jgi:tetratricopeptide (TPR) repeat protein
MRIWQLLLRLGVFVAVLLVLAFPGRGQTEDAQSHADAGIQFARSGDLARAADELRRAVMLAPTNAEFLSTLGTVLAMDKKLEESSAAFRKALQFAPQDSTVRRYLAANLWQLHHYPEAKRELQIILHEHPNDTQSRLLLGMVSENSGDYSTAAKMPVLCRMKSKTTRINRRSAHSLPTAGRKRALRCRDCHRMEGTPSHYCSVPKLPIRQATTLKRSDYWIQSVNLEIHQPIFGSERQRSNITPAISPNAKPRSSRF